MDLRDYYALIANTPMPTQRQFEQFAKHLATVHSWYRGRLDGAQFVVLLDPDAGNGFTETFINTWKLSPSAYVERFGHLTYAEPGHGNWVVGDDGGQRVVDPPSEILKDCRGRLYPFVYPLPNGARYFLAVGRLRNEFLMLERGERDHPCRELLLSCFRLAPKYLELKWAVEEGRSNVAAAAATSTTRATAEWSYRQVDPSYLAAQRELDVQARLLEQEAQLPALRAQFNVLLKALYAHGFEEITRALRGLHKHLRMAGIKD